MGEKKKLKNQENPSKIIKSIILNKINLKTENTIKVANQILKKFMKE